MTLASQPTEEDAPPEDDIFGWSGNGSLHFHTSKSADVEYSKMKELNVGICTGDFDAIYTSALKSIGLEPVDTSGHYNWESFEVNRQRFALEFPQFPMMVSYEDMYQDYVLGPGEISGLLKECRALQGVELSFEANLTLRKLIYGCEEAVKIDGNLIFVCD